MIHKVKTLASSGADEGVKNRRVIERKTNLAPVTG
jgi:hypothetical protein